MAHDTTAERPLFWRVGSGVMYAEMPYAASIRPPLLSPWESERVQRFRNTERRRQWLAGRALAKALVRERLDLQGIVDIREGSDGEPLVFRDGLPLPDVWLGIVVRHGRICAAVADRPVGIDVQALGGQNDRFARRVLDRRELRAMRRVFRSEMPLSVCAGWAVKEASVRAARSRCALGDVHLDETFTIEMAEGRMRALAIRVLADSVVAIVARPRVDERSTTRVIFTDRSSLENPSRVAALGTRVERLVARSRVPRPAS